MNYYEILSSNEYKLTKPRKLVLETIEANKDIHLNSQEVYDLIKKKDPSIGIASIYRCLNLFTELQILNNVDFGDGTTRYELTDSNNAHQHHHLICKNCGKIVDIVDVLDPIEELIQSKYNFCITDHKLDIYGYCSECKKNCE